MNYKNRIEALFFRTSRGLFSRIRLLVYKLLGLKAGHHNRMEYGRIRRADQITLGNYNAFSEGFQLWPEDTIYDGFKIFIGSHNYFNKNVMIDACRQIEIGDHNMFGPDVYITDSNHSFGKDISPQKAPMQRGIVKIGSHCWIGAKVVILKDVVLGDYCVVAAGAVVTKSFPSGCVIGGVPAKIIKGGDVVVKSQI